MSARVTRGSAAKKAASMSDKENTMQLSSPPATPASAQEKAKIPKIPIFENPSPNAKGKANDAAAPLTTPKSPNKSASSTKKGTVRKSSAKDGARKEESKVLLSPGKKRKRPATPEGGEFDELPHNMGRVPKVSKIPIKDEVAAHAGITAPRPVIKKHSVKQEEIEEAEKVAVKNVEAADSTPKPPKKKPRSAKGTADTKKPKVNTYGLTEGISPFPDYSRPTLEECQKVHHILQNYHHLSPQPKTVPPPSEFVAGCGEVPSILDALIRTRLSAATTGNNSSNAYQGMVARYGNSETGVGKGSVDYKAVRLAPQKDLFDAIKCGGLADVKSRDIKKILDMVYEENQARRTAFLAAKKTHNEAAAPKGADLENDAQREAEISLADNDILSLDHYYALPTYDALLTFAKYPGIGVKTAACVAMFSMQRPCFAVDTHVFRLCQWLGWVPPEDYCYTEDGKKIKGAAKVERDTAFSHLEVRIPDELKYNLHQLFIKHGKTCPRCRAATGMGSEGWDEGCVIDDLVQRTGKRKGGMPSPAKKAKVGSSAKVPKGERKTPVTAKNASGVNKVRKVTKSKKVIESEDEEEESMEDLGDEEEDDDLGDEDENDE